MKLVKILASFEESIFRPEIQRVIFDYRHSAVDEESPGCISKSLTAPADSRDLSLSLDTSGSIVFPLDSAASAEQFAQLRKIEGKSKSGKEALRFRCSTVAESQPSNLPVKSRDSKYFVQENLTGKSPSPKDQDTSSDFEGKTSVKLPVVKESTLFSNREDSTRIPSSPEDDSDQEIVEVRKDSALFLEEAEGLPALREILRARAPRIIRPRRESSGYASNLGTFDEDRRNSSSVDVLQDLSSFLKERRRSSAGPKRLNSRVIVGRTEESLTEEVDCERMPTTEIHRKVSGAGLEMPNIEEAKEILRDEAHSRQESSDNLYELTEDVSRHQDVSSSVFDVSSISQSISRLSTSPSRTASNQQVHRLLSSSLSSSKLFDKSDQFIDRSKAIGIEDESIREPTTNRSKEKSIQKQELQLSVLPRSIKMYRLMSTQSEDRIDGELQLDRRISFQMSKQNDVTASSKDPRDLSSSRSENVSMLKSSASSDIQALASTELADDSSIRTVCSSGEVGTSQRYLGDASNVTVRPIYPYCPYSPYGSPQGSPRNRRRPLRESRRVSIDNRQGALQLNQYKLLDNIGQVRWNIFVEGFFCL